MKEYLYGINPAFEAVRAGRRKIYKAHVADGIRTSPRTAKLLELFAKADCPVAFVNKGRLFELCRTTEHQGVVVEAGAYPYAAFQELLQSERLLLLDNIEDPQNAGAILRSAEAFGWQQVLLANRGTPEVYPSVVKASAGASEYLRIARDHSANDYTRLAAENGFTILALDRNGPTAINDLEISTAAKLMVVIGGEHKAVGQFILNMAQHVVKIPLKGRVTSLNASVAAGIALFSLKHAGRPLAGNI